MRENWRKDREALFDVLAASIVCHLGVIVDGNPMVVPTVYGSGSTPGNPVARSWPPPRCLRCRSWTHQ
jgi:hypothetical protein